ncbi:mannitol-1-phosphate 5-dehydrogenase [Oceanispirochaeta sp.]|jgi:mannitol-1-phosphate 5-dehydrogenase|uniref:mannitol dehydrogenase family protein n=1 Tax=Oceanispirochaeta sp. TaxID=2035350 RepID=UPI0026300CE5|nr:mannitol-1-phosphate 5-dehydrogenase [Oceanispirochaeta sp.]MDA3956618.1 mannitol-1-phosphate 5-dehydrogenase [Oceanispirochaeta sp.]
MKQAVLFGGGNIGRSFITPVFQDAGYKMTIIDMNRELIQDLRDKKQYTIIICENDKQTETVINGFQSLSLDESVQIREVLLSADIVISSVGQWGLPAVMALIAKVLPQRIENSVNHPLDIILAENIPGGGEYCRSFLREQLSAEFPPEKIPGIVETSIGKMVPFISEDDRAIDPLRVYAEPYNTLILDREGFKGEYPISQDIKLVSPIQAYVDRKLYIHNLGHAAAAYLGRSSHSEMKTICEVLADPEILNKVRSLMLQCAAALIQEYSGVFTREELEEHVEDLLFRFRNPSLGDSVQRVGRDLKRKLAPQDRICGAMRLILKHQMPADALGEVYRASLSFGLSNEADQEDREICRDAAAQGIIGIYRSLSSLGDKWDKQIENLLVL